MKFFIGSVQTLINGPRIQQDRGEHNEFNNISQHLHPNHHVKLQEFLESEKPFLSDLLASLITQYHITLHIDRDNLMRNCMETISENLHNLGAEEIPNSQFIDKVREHSLIKAIVFGYQDSRGMERRVEALARTLAMIDRRCDVLFVGAYSASMGSQIPAETNKMRILFDQYSRTHNVKSEMISTHTENSSLDTIQNIKLAIKEEFVSHRRSNEKQCILFISSTFHLIRIAEEFKKIMTVTDNAQDDHLKSERDFIERNIDHLFWVGAEDRLTPLHGRDRTYVKNMLFDVIRKNIK